MEGTVFGHWYFFTISGAEAMFIILSNVIIFNIFPRNSNKVSCHLPQFYIKA